MAGAGRRIIKVCLKTWKGLQTIDFKTELDRQIPGYQYLTLGDKYF
jgi:hypothetical protein